jgi:hypothetical protein
MKVLGAGCAPELWTDWFSGVGRNARTFQNYRKIQRVEDSDLCGF